MRKRLEALGVLRYEVVIDLSALDQQSRHGLQEREVASGGHVKEAVGDYLLANPGKTAAEVVVACYGLAFKADIDDLRESPALAIATRIASELPGKNLIVEPNITSLPSVLAGKAKLVDCNTAIEQVDILVMLVDHREFKEISKDQLQDRALIDTRGLWSLL